MTKIKEKVLFTEFLNSFKTTQNLFEFDNKLSNEMLIQASPIISFVSFLANDNEQEIINLIKNESLDSRTLISSGNLKFSDHLFMWQFKDDEISVFSLLALLKKHNLLEEILKVSPNFLKDEREHAIEDIKDYERKSYSFLSANDQHIFREKKPVKFMEALYYNDDLATFRVLKNYLNISSEHFLQGFAHTYLFLAKSMPKNPEHFLPPQKIIHELLNSTSSFKEKTSDLITLDFLLERLSEDTQQLMIKNQPILAKTILSHLPNLSLFDKNFTDNKEVFYNNAFKFIKLCLNDSEFKQSYLQDPPLWALFLENSTSINSHFMKKMDFPDLKQEAINYYNTQGFKHKTYGTYSTLKQLEKLGVDITSNINGNNALMHALNSNHIPNMNQMIDFFTKKKPQLFLTKNKVKDQKILLDIVKEFLKINSFNDNKITQIEDSILKASTSNASKLKVKKL